jgi:hypothetical protein
MPELGDAPIEDKHYEVMNTVAQALDKVFNGKDAAPRSRQEMVDKRQTGFVLLVFPFESVAKGDSRCNFISNGADRKDVVALFKEMIARFEGQPEMEGKA